MGLKDQISVDMKSALRAHDSARLGAIRLLLSAIKQKEVDERIEADDNVILSIVTKLVKQRRDSVEQYSAGGRDDLAEKELFEIEVLNAYLPKQLSDQEVEAIITEAIAAVNAEGPQAMGKVMGLVKPKLFGKADMGKVSGLIKARLVK